MSVVDNDIRLLLLIVLDKYTSKVRLCLLVILNARVELVYTHSLHLSPPDRTRDNTVTEHTESKEWQ